MTPGNCRHCGYNILALAQDAACPECGTAVALSRTSLLLADADPGWIGVLHRGARVLLCGAVLLQWIFYAFGAATLLLTLLARWVSPVRLFVPAMSLIGGIMAMALLVGVAGAYMISAPDPRDAHQAPAISSRRVVRASVLACAGSLAICATILMTPTGSAFRPLLRPLLVFSGAALVVAELALLRVLRDLASRVPAPRVMKQALQVERLGRWLLPLPVIFLLMMPLIAPLARAGGGAWSPWFLIAFPALFLGLVIILRVFGAAAEASREIIRIAQDVAPGRAPGPAHPPGPPDP